MNAEGGTAIDLAKHPVVHGHPLHAILSDGPVVLIPLALGIAAWRRIGSDKIGQPLTVLGLINAAGIVALIGVSTGGKRRAGLLTAATAGLLVAAWIGGDFERRKTFLPAH